MAAPVEVLTGTVEGLLGVARAGIDPAAPRVLFVTGGPGGGRTTTLERLARSLRDGGSRVRLVRTDDHERTRPYGVLTELLGLRSDAASHGDVLGLALTAIETACRGGSLTLMVDDAHHADPDSLAALIRLADSTRDLPLGFVLSRLLLPQRSSLTTLSLRSDAAEVRLRGLDDDACEQAVRERFGAPPGPELRAVVARTDGMPYRLTVLLDDLDRRGVVRTVDGLATIPETDDGPVQTVAASTTALLHLLDATCREILQVLAVWGGPASPRVVATILDTTPGAIVTTASRAVHAEVLDWDASGRLWFRRTSYHEVVLDELAPPVRWVLDEACRSVRRGNVVAQDGGGQGPLDVRAALRTAAADLTRAPARSAELLDALAEQVGDGPEADEVALHRAGAKAVLGDGHDAERIARERRARSTDPLARAELTRLIVFTLISGAEVDPARREIDAALERVPPGSAAAENLADVRRWLGVLAGREPVGPPPPATGPPDSPSVTTLICDAVDLFLAARTGEALARAEQAAARRSEQNLPAWHHGPTAEVWPAFLALYHDGPHRARELSIEARRALHRDGQLWLTPYHQFVSAGVHVLSGQWDDALAEAESGLEAAEVTGTGWISLPTSALAQVHVRRGDLDAAAGLIRRWKSRDLPEQFGLALMAHAEALLLEAQDRPVEAAALVERSWRRAVTGGRHIWALLIGPEAVRIAMAAEDDALVTRITTDVAAVPIVDAAAVAPCTGLLAALAAHDPPAAAAAATAYRAVGNVLGELVAWELVACLAGRAGDRDLTATAARRCTAVAATVDAPIVGRRLAARLRTLGVRQGSTVSRRRPQSGWGSLTPTELQVTDLVARGLTSPQIAGRLFVSPRTVQTHISHVLRKLGLRSRVEIAAEVVRQRPV